MARKSPQKCHEQLHTVNKRKKKIVNFDKAAKADREKRKFWNMILPVCMHIYIFKTVLIFIASIYYWIYYTVLPVTACCVERALSFSTIWIYQTPFITSQLPNWATKHPKPAEVWSVNVWVQPDSAKFHILTVVSPLVVARVEPLKTEHITVCFSIAIAVCL